MLCSTELWKISKYVQLAKYLVSDDNHILILSMESRSQKCPFTLAKLTYIHTDRYREEGEGARCVWNKDLKDFYHSLSSRDQFQSLTSNDRSAGMRPQSQQSDSFVTLKQIHDDFKDASNNHTTSKYYNICAYITSKFMNFF